MRLIDADALYEKADKYAGGSFAVGLILEAIKKAPTVEAEPIRHAYWKTNVYASQVVVCSFCNNTSLVPTTYCGNCGAKMENGG